MIEKYLNAVICGNIQEMSVRKLIVKTFIREAILDNDALIITYFFTEQYSKHDITPEEVAIIKKQSKKQAAFPLNLGSYKLASTPPTSEVSELASDTSVFLLFLRLRRCCPLRIKNLVLILRVVAS